MKVDSLSAASVSGLLSTAWAGRPVVFEKEVDSTNLMVRRLADQGMPHGTLALAELQMAGRGRRGREWFSPEGSGIWMSLLLRPALAAEKISMLTIITAMAVYDGLAPLVSDLSIKWPNDLLIGQKKVCGILTEMVPSESSLPLVVVGIGINVNTEDFPEDLAEIATSLRAAAGKSFDRSRIIADIMQAFEARYAQLTACGDLRDMREAYEDRLVCKNRRINMISPAGVTSGTAEGIDDLGHLLVRMAGGSLQSVMSGEISVRNSD